MHPFFRVLLCGMITSYVAMLALNWLFRDGEDTDRSVRKYQEAPFFPDIWFRGKFGVWLTIVIATAIGTFHGLPIAWIQIAAWVKRALA